jgi:hypothetical protein
MGVKYFVLSSDKMVSEELNGSREGRKRVYKRPNDLFYRDVYPDLCGPRDGRSTD